MICCSRRKVRGTAEKSVQTISGRKRALCLFDRIRPEKHRRFGNVVFLRGAIPGRASSGSWRGGARAIAEAAERSSTAFLGGMGKGSPMAEQTMGQYVQPVCCGPNNEILGIGLVRPLVAEKGFLRRMLHVRDICLSPGKGAGCRFLSAARRKYRFRQWGGIREFRADGTTCLCPLG